MFGTCHRAWLGGLFLALVVIFAGCASGTPAASRSSKTPLHQSSTTAAPTVTTNGPPSWATSTSTTTAEAMSSAPPCQNFQISVSDAGGGSGLGHQDQVILFTNHSQSSCSLSGYPGVAGLNAQGGEAVQAERTLGGYLGGVQPGAATPPVVSLAPGQIASATVEGTDNPIGLATSCPYYPYLLVTPPNLADSARLTVSDLGRPNNPGLPGCTKIEVHPVVPGSSGRVD
jgi:Protein of unknown function (DUF4232)